MTRVDVVVIGAGISGLSAAKLLVEDGINVVVLEARDRVGGRTHTIRDSAYGYTDVGGAYVGPTQRRVARMMKELGLELYNVESRKKTIWKIQDQTYILEKNIPIIYNPIAIMDLNNMQRKLDQYAEQVPVAAPWQAIRATEWDNMSFQQFIDATCWTQIARTGAKLAVNALLCVEPSEVSFLYMLWYIASGQGLQRLTTVTNGAQEKKIVGGAQQLSEKMVGCLGEGVVKLSTPVIKVEENNSDVRVTTANGDVYIADHVISAMPQSLLNRVTFEPPLPPMKLQLIQRMPMGSIIKTIMFYEKTFWKDKGLNGELATERGPIFYCVDDTKPDGSSPAIMGFILADQARDWLTHTYEERKAAVAEHYAREFGLEEFSKPINYVEKNWMEEEYSGGCYVAAMPPGVMTRYGHMLRKPHGRTFWAGTESATYWAGYMEGAIQAGERAAREVEHALGMISPDEVWKEEPIEPSLPEPPVTVLFVEKVMPSIGGLLKGLAGFLTVMGIGVAVGAFLIKKYDWNLKDFM